MTDRILLGRRKDDGELCFLSKHEWDCEWYWAFGYLGNRNSHYHFESLLGKRIYIPADIFSETNISEKEWWIIRDLFVQAYALKNVAEVYQYGGHQSSRAGVTDLIKSAEKAAIANADLEKILDTLWHYASASVAPKGEKS
jgi:hypothetical protein